MSDEKAEPGDTQPTDVATVAETAGTSATRPLPVQPEAVPVAEPAAEPETVPVKKRKRWPFVVGGIVLVLAILLVIAYIVGENYAKDYARDYIKSRIVAVLGIEDASQVTVDIGDGSVLLQAIAGRLNEVDIDAGTVTFGTLTGEATVHAEGVPLDTNDATETLDVTFAVTEDQVVGVLGSNLSGLPIDSITFEQPEILVTATVNLFFFQIPVGMGLEPSAEEGEIVFTPSSVQLFDENFTVAEASEQLGGIADQLFAKQSICVNESLPVALTIVDVAVRGEQLVVAINGDGVVMGGTGLSTPGTCAA